MLSLPGFAAFAVLCALVHFGGYAFVERARPGEDLGYTFSTGFCIGAATAVGAALVGLLVDASCRRSRFMEDRQKKL